MEVHLQQIESSKQCHDRVKMRKTLNLEPDTRQIRKICIKDLILCQPRLPPQPEHRLADLGSLCRHAASPPSTQHSTLGLSHPHLHHLLLSFSPNLFSSKIDQVNWRSMQGKPWVLIASAPDLSGLCRPALSGGQQHLQPEFGSGKSSCSLEDF